MDSATNKKRFWDHIYILVHAYMGGFIAVLLLDSYKLLIYDFLPAPYWFCGVLVGHSSTIDVRLPPWYYGVLVGHLSTIDRGAPDLALTSLRKAEHSFPILKHPTKSRKLDRMSRGLLILGTSCRMNK